MENYDTNEEQKLKRQAIVLSVILGVLVVLGLWINLRQGVSVGEDFLHRKSEVLYRKGKDTVEMVKQPESARVEAFLDGEKYSAVMTWSETDSPYGKYQVRVTFSDGEVKEGIWGRDGELLGTSGMALWMEGLVSGDATIKIVAVNGEPYVGNQSRRIGNLTLANAFCQIAFEEPIRAGHAGLVLIGAIMYIVGALGFLFPEEMYFLFSRWRYYQPELSDAGIWWEKAGAVCAMVVGAVFMLGLIAFFV